MSRYLTKREAADYAHVSVATIERAMRSHALTVGGTPGRVLILPEEIDRWLASRHDERRCA